MNEIKLHLGCGKRNWPGWVSIDIADFPHITSNDVYLKDVPDDSVDIIYSSHLVSYFSRKEIECLLREWHRVLKIGGTLQIATPDLDELAKIILIDCDDDYNLLSVIGPMYGEMIVNESTIYHKTGYNYATLKLFLNFNNVKGHESKSAFVDIKRYDHTKTCHPNTGNRDDFYDDHSAAYYHNKLISLNIQAIKSF